MDENIKSVSPVFKDDAMGIRFELPLPADFVPRDFVLACLTAVGETDLIPPSGWNLRSSSHDPRSGRSQWVLSKHTWNPESLPWVALTSRKVSHRRAVVYVPSEALIERCSQPASEEELRSYWPES